MDLDIQILFLMCLINLFPSLYVVDYLLRLSIRPKEHFRVNTWIRGQGHRREGHTDCVLRIPDWVTLFTCSSSTVDHLLRCSRSEISSFSTWFCWTSSSSASAKSSNVVFSSSSNFCSSFCSSLSKILRSWLNSVCILCLSVCIWYCKYEQEREVMSLSTWEPTVRGIRSQESKYFFQRVLTIRGLKVDEQSLGKLFSP